MIDEILQELRDLRTMEDLIPLADNDLLTKDNTSWQTTLLIQ